MVYLKLLRDSIDIDDVLDFNSSETAADTYDKYIDV